METFQLSFPISKVNKQKRIVTGIATADNVDSERDLVTFEASRDAFNNWMGNIREMHGKNAVGKAVSIEEVPVQHDGKYYNGIEVSAYVSEGAQDTWTKVLENILVAYSIGGKIQDCHYMYDEKSGEATRVVTKYELGELSLVDNPGNPLARLTLVKSNDDGTLSVTEPANYGIFYCDGCKVATINKSVCPTCSNEIDVMGFTNDVSLPMVNKMIIAHEHDKIEKVNNMETNTEGANDLTKSDKADIVGDNMDVDAEKEINVIAKFCKALFGGSLSETITKAATAEGSTEAVATDTVVEESQEIIKDGGSEVDLNEAMEGLFARMDETLTKFKGEIETSIETKIAEKFDSHAEEVTKSVESLTTKVDETSASVAGVVEKVNSLDGEGAVKKSADLADEEDEVIEKSEASNSFWGGSFVPDGLVKAFGYDE